MENSRTENFIKKNNLGPGLIVNFKNDSKEYTIKNLSSDRKEVFVTDKDGNVKCKKILAITKLQRKPVLVEAVQYQPTEIKDILWNTFKDKVSDITFNGKDNNNYVYTITVDKDTTLNEISDTLQELFDTDMFDVTVTGSDKVMIEFMGSEVLTEEVKTSESELERLAKKLHTDVDFIKKQIEAGKKVETEHKDTVDWLQKYYKDNGKFPPDDEIFEHISVNHIEELKKYYIGLKQMEKKLDKQQLNEGSTPFTQTPIQVELPDGTYYGIWKDFLITLDNGLTFDMTLKSRNPFKVRIEVKDGGATVYGATLDEGESILKEAGEETIDPQEAKLEKNQTYIDFKRDIERVIQSLEDIYLNETYLQFTNKDTNMGKSMAYLLQTAKQIREGVENSVVLTESVKRLIKEEISPLVEQILSKRRIDRLLNSIESILTGRSPDLYELKYVVSFLRELKEAVPLVRLKFLGESVIEKDDNNKNDTEKQLLFDKKLKEGAYDNLTFTREDVESVVESLYPVQDKAEGMLVITVPNKFKSDAMSLTHYEIVVYYSNDYLAVYPQTNDKDGVQTAEEIENKILETLNGVNKFAKQNVMTEDLNTTPEEWQGKADEVVNNFIMKTFGKGHEALPIEVISSSVEPEGDTLEDKMTDASIENEDSVTVNFIHTYKVKVPEGDTNIEIEVTESWDMNWSKNTPSRGISEKLASEEKTYSTWTNIMVEGQYVSLTPESKQILNKAFNYRKPVKKNIQEAVTPEEIKEGDYVYWIIKAGMFPRTISGKVTKIEGDVATIYQQTQNSSGTVQKKLRDITKRKRQ